MDLHRLQVFAKVYEMGSLSRAAEAVYLSQPTVSGHIKALEDELGVRLFDRLGRGVAPTRQAEVLHEYALKLIALRDEALEAVAEASEQVKGELSVGGSTIPGHYLLPAYLAQMRSLYPELIVRLTVADTRSIALKVAAGELEMGVIGARLDDPKLKYAACCQDELILVAPPDLKPAGGPRLKPAGLTDLPFLLREAGSGTRMVTAQALDRLGVSLADLNVVAELGSTQAVRQAILAGLGASILSSLAVGDDVRSGRLVQLEVEGLNINATSS